MKESDTIRDDRLRLIFTCCHPALALEARVALTLRMLGGLSTAEIARALLVAETTMAKRLTRAKAKIAAAAIPYRVPPPELLPERTGGVLAVLYLMFNEGYLASAGNQLTRTDLSAEAIRLTRLLVTLMPDEPEATGLLALMLSNDARRAARIGPGGELIPLESQDRGSWDRAQIDEAAVLLDHGLRRGPAGPYLLQAAIAGLHCQAATPEDTDWSEIAALYTLLLIVLDSPVVRLNRAVATAMARDIDAGLEELAALEADPRLAGYHLLPAARADLLRPEWGRRGRRRSIPARARAGANRAGAALHTRAAGGAGPLRQEPPETPAPHAPYPSASMQRRQRHRQTRVAIACLVSVLAVVGVVRP